MREGGRGKRWLLAIWRALRWEPRSYVQILVVVLVGYLVCVVVFRLLVGLRNGGGFTYVLIAAPWLGIGTGMSLSLQLRRSR